MLSYLLLRRALGGLETGRLLGFLNRILGAALAGTAVAYLTGRGLDATVDEPTQLMAALIVVVVATATGITFLSLAWALGVPEVTMLVGLVTRRMKVRR